MMQEQDASWDGAERVTLSVADVAALDALVEGRVAEDAVRAERVKGWLKVIGAAKAPTVPADLVARTLARVQSERMKIPVVKEATAPLRLAGRRYGWVRDLAAMSVAASVLGAVVILGVGQARQSGRRVACASNLMTVATAFEAYAGRNGGALPALAMPADRNWLRAGTQGHTNAENLLPLAQAGLIRPANLVCAGRMVDASDPDSGRGYSYVNLYGAHRPAWDGGHGTIVLGDRNPLFDAQATIDPQSNSANHGRHGNYVVRADGSVTWETSPNVGVGRDNIWTLGRGPEYRTGYVGTETAAVVGDTFLAP